MEDANEATAAVVHDEIEAEMLCALLRTAGIHSYHRDATIEGTLDGVAALGGMGRLEIRVPADDLDRAIEVLESGNNLRG
jgi:uncharacterized protein CbrC (UPF0167 family)